MVVMSCHSVVTIIDLWTPAYDFILRIIIAADTGFV